MSIDSRLANPTILLLAAFRLRERRQNQAPDWRSTVGLSSLLAAANALPPRDPWSLPDLDPRDGLGRLLAEARQWQQEGGHGPA